MLHTPNEAANRSSRCPIHSHEHKRMQGTRWSDLQQGTAKETKSFPNSMSRNRASRDQYHSLNSRGGKKKKRSAEKDERSSQLRTVPLDRLAACDAGQDEEEEEEKERADGQEPGGGGGGGHGRVGKLRLRARMDSSGARRGRPYEREREREEERGKVAPRRGRGWGWKCGRGEWSGVEWADGHSHSPRTAARTLTRCLPRRWVGRLGAAHRDCDDWNVECRRTGAEYSILLHPSKKNKP